MTNTIVAMITTRTHREGEPTQVLVDVTTPDGQRTGLHHTSVINCANLFTLEQANILHTIGNLSVALMQQVEAALKTALELK